MPATLLDEQQTSRLLAAPLSFTRAARSEGEAPAGYNHLSRSVTLTRRDFDGAARHLFEWQMHCKAGLRVQASDIPLHQDTVVLMQWGPAPLALRIPCRVLEVIDEPRRRGFAYGTLPGHPEAGEERFILEQLEDGRILFTITAYSRPASTLAKVGGPITRAAQNFMTHRYLTALDRV
ncbi:DUF1990 domain-containing protein [Yimella sp. cx-51]|uniref:DUF1990 domain-containing protein n=1 Tax=Yimella sp. cx-51 TaxID=2770551 RepID=UPI00165E4347|nr:DUF1990 domain-containing protein [Yimella sp. cx-51]MBC9956182.1 DUF1990 domain-containing protein [Yimella sp. cx-51]QTH38666.1 DUF1990 domain-containing protein [Yimella sp. cx-51]